LLISQPKEIQDWKTATESILTRHHRVHRLYTCNDRGDDLLMTGTLTLESRTGLVAEAPYCARCVVDDGDSDAPRIKHWQGWLVGIFFFFLATHLHRGHGRC